MKARGQHRRWWSLWLLPAVLALAVPAAASWPMARHDAKRTGAAEGASDIVAPVAYWKTFLGGRLEPASMIAAEINGDGEREFVIVSGGRAVAKHANDDLVWQTLPLDLSRIVGIDDLDGDGSVDVVVASADHVYVLAGATGLIEWAEQDHEMGTIDAVRMGDLDGDGKPEVVIQECVCCAVSTPTFGVVYSFGKGYANAARLWSFPTAGCAAGRSLTLADINGDGRSEVLISDNSVYLALNGADGTVLASSGALGNWVGWSNCRAANVDGVPGAELLCIQNSSNPPGSNQRRAFALHYTAAPASLSLAWATTLAPDQGGDIAFVDPVVDLDGDGQPEVVVGAKDATGTWNTLILNAATGVEQARVPNRRLVGTAPIGPGGQVLILTSSATDLIAHAYSGPQSAIVAVWTASGRVVATQPDWTVAKSCSTADRVVTADVNADSVADLLSVVPTTSEVQAISGQNGTRTASISLGAGVESSAIWVLPAMGSQSLQVAVARTDGFLALFDGALRSAASATADAPGIRVGGYFATGWWRDLQRPPITAQLDGQKADRIIVTDSRGALLRLDAQTASLASPPRRIWEKSRTTGPVAVAGLGGGMGVVAINNPDPLGDPLRSQIQALAADGTVLWTQPVGSVPLNDLVPAKFDADNVADIAFQSGDPTNVLLQTHGLSGATGTTLWNAEPFDPGAGRQPSGISVGDWNGDGVDDVFTQGNGTRVISGVNGSQLAIGGPLDAYFMPTLVDVNGDGVDEVTLHGGYSPARTITHDLKGVIWAGTEDDRPYPYGAVANCNGGPVLTEGSAAFPSRLKFTRIGGPSVGVATTLVLAGGRTFADEATARASGARLGQLTSVAVHTNLTGRSHPSALVGSSEGWLYGINPCNGVLDFSASFDASVGSPVFGDTDGDGRDEIIVPVADGYLYGVKNRAIEAPPFIWDVDLAHGVVDRDLADIESRDTLSARWGKVEGATSYEVAVLDARGEFATAPPWREVGLELTAAIAGLPLRNGERYRFVVRAVGARGPSVDVISNGVIVHFAPDFEFDAGLEAGVEASVDGASDSSAEASVDGAPESAIEGGGCSCRTGRSPDGNGGLGAGVVLGIVAVLSRRRGRSFGLRRSGRQG